jgi:hypothetical protein
MRSLQHLPAAHRPRQRRRRNLRPVRERGHRLHLPPVRAVGESVRPRALRSLRSRRAGP